MGNCEQLGIEYIVVYSTDGGNSDHWQPFEYWGAAESFYENLLQEDDTYTASITRILKSTDYSGENENL